MEPWFADIGPDSIDTLSGEASQHDAPHFRTKGMISDFCACSIYTIQTLNEEVIRPALAKLLRTSFFRFFRVDLEVAVRLEHAPHERDL